MVAVALRADRPEPVAQGTFEWPEDDAPLRIPRGPLSLALVSALLSPRLAAPSGALAATAPKRRSAGPAVFLEPVADGDGAADVGEPPCPLTLDVALVVLDLLQRGGGVTTLSPRTVLSRKGYRRWGGERQDFERKLLEQIRLIQRMTLETDGVRAPLLQFAARNVARTDFIVRASPAFAAELKESAWTELPNPVLRLDHRRNRGSDVLAKKMAVALAAGERAGLVRPRDLLTAIGHRPERGAGRRNHTVERLPSALFRLRTLGIVEVDGLEAIERLKADRRAWLDEPLWLRLRQPGQETREPLSQARTLTVTAVDTAIEHVAKTADTRRGRPRFQPSQEDRRLVRALFAGGASRERIAQAVGVSLPTLRAYFAVEFRDAVQAPEVACLAKGEALVTGRPPARRPRPPAETRHVQG